MKDFFEILVEFIMVDIFITYGLYSIVLVGLTFFVRNNDSLEKFDYASNNLVSFSGVVYLTSLVALICLTPPVLTFERYWWGPWLQPVVWILITQLLWIERIRQSKIARIVIALLLIVSFERFVIIVTSFHRDYVPSGWENVLTPTEWILGFVLKISIFFALTFVSLYITYKIKRIKVKTN